MRVQNSQQILNKRRYGEQETQRVAGAGRPPRGLGTLGTFSVFFRDIYSLYTFLLVLIVFVFCLVVQCFPLVLPQFIAHKLSCSSGHHS